MGSRTAAKEDLLSAQQTVVRALQSLTPEGQQRVLTAALAILGISQADSVSLGSEAARPPASSPSLSSRPMSPRELIQQKQPATNAQRIAIFAYFRDKTEGQPRFARGDLKQYFGKARENQPQNYDRDFTSAVKLGYIYEDGSDSYLTSRGVEAVEAGFGGRVEPRRNAKKAANKLRKSR
jgi:hypothetical protein